MDFSWNELAKKKTISVLAPMEDVTDAVFRQMMLSMGKPDVFFYRVYESRRIVLTW
jgi:tRNA-dihydrouridine synthase